MAEPRTSLPAPPGAEPQPPARPARRAASYGPFARLVLGWFFGAVEFPSEAREPLEQAARRGPLVYVLRSSALLHLVYFNWTFFRLGLPVARAATGLGYRILAPFARWYLGGRQIEPPRSAPRGERAIGQVIEAVRQGESALVFLRLPRTLPSVVAALADPFPELVALQRAQAGGVPIQLIPLTLLWRRRPKKLRASLRDALFGDPDAPGAIRAFIGFLLNRRGAFVKVGAPVDLAAVLADDPSPQDLRVARRVRGFLHQHLAREARVVTGPPLKDPERVAHQTLGDRTLRRALAEIARERGEPSAAVERQARKNLREIAARYNPIAVDLLKRVVRFLFNRIYDGIDVDEAGMKRLRELGARAPLVLCPCHKSHIDYLVLSVICDDCGLQPPHVAAGDNLNFWPVGRLLRMGGAFFIRRSFKGDRVYQGVLAAYVKRLLRDGFTQEFFVEGSRSRTGKLLPPKLGMLALEVEAWLTGVRPDVHLVPISISYEKIAEASAYQRELLGEEKEKENARALIVATKVVRTRQGRIAIRVGEPISLAQLFRERRVDPTAHGVEDRRALVRALGLRVAAGINRAAPLASMGLVCAVLLSHDARALAEEELSARFKFLHRVALGTHETQRRPLPPRPAAAALESLIRDGSVRRQDAGGERFYSVAEERRMALDYQKNSILHFLVAPAILASALRSFGGQPAPVGELFGRAKELSRLLKHEFIYEPGRSFEAIVGEMLDLLLRWGLAERHDEAIAPAVAGLRRCHLLADLLRPFVEGVWVATDSAGVLLADPMETKEWIRLALDRGRAAYLAGRIRRPESLSKATLENALLMLRDRGVLLEAAAKSAKLEFAPAFRSVYKLAALADEVDRFLV